MIVQLIAKTVIVNAVPGYTWNEVDHVSPTHSDELAEMAGRLCYESWPRPNPQTASNKGYISNIIAQRHFSVLEHSSATFFVAGVSRSLLAELSRHRHLSFSVVSQRYVDHGLTSGKKTVTPPVFGDDQILNEALEVHMHHSQTLYDQTVAHLTHNYGATRKEARGAARAFLPEATETAMVVTGNMRTWREIIEKRNSLAADQEIREMAQKILKILKGVAPNTFQDME